MNKKLINVLHARKELFVVVWMGAKNNHYRPQSHLTSFDKQGSCVYKVSNNG
jgi:hypothetical protein